MKVTDETVDQIANLARLKFEGEARMKIKEDMNRMLEFVGKLDELDTDNVEPLIFMTDETNVLRPDEANNPITQEEALRNAPEHDSDYFKIPKVLKKS